VADHDSRPPPAYATGALVTGARPPPGTVLAASDTGITPTTVTLGVIIPSLGVLGSFGIDVSVLDPRLQRTYWQSAVDRLNASGGVQGRRVAVVFANASILSRDSMRAACLTLTEDRRVFAVGNVLGIAGDPLLCVTRDHATPYLAVDGQDSTAYAQSAGRLVTLEPSHDRTLRLFAERLGALGLVRGRTVGVVRDTGPAGVDGEQVRRLLLAAGARAVVDGPLGTEDPLLVSGEAAAAERRMHAAGVDAVVLMTNAVYATVFATQADQQKWSPEYLMSDLGYATAGDSFVSNMPASFYRDAVAVTTTEVGRGRAKLPETPLDAGCRLDYQRAVGHPVARDGADAVQALATCAVVQLLTMGLDGAGPNPTRASFAAALDRAGAFAVPGFGRGMLGPQRPDAADDVATAVAQGGTCQCYVAVDGYRPAP
jgi:ABC-type branched-subunit amino acid transport system substrate-binding protein